MALIIWNKYIAENDVSEFECYTYAKQSRTCACLPEKWPVKWCMYAEYSKLKESTVNTRFPTRMHMLCSVGSKPDQLTTTIICYRIFIITNAVTFLQKHTSIIIIHELVTDVAIVMSSHHAQCSSACCFAITKPRFTGCRLLLHYATNSTRVIISNYLTC